MGYYEVDLQSLSNVVKNIDNQVALVQGEIDQLSSSINGLGNSWKGVDYKEFKKAFDTDAEGVVKRWKKLEKEMLDYRAFYNESVKRYTDAQATAEKYVLKIPTE